MRALGWIRLAAAILLYFALDVIGRLGARAAKGARWLDLRIDDWRHDQQRHDDVVRSIVDNVAYRIRCGGTTGAEEYEYLDDRDVERLARAIDNLGCYARVWSRRAEWDRRDRSPTGERVTLAALPPADRDAWAEAIGNLDGETGP